MIDTEGLKRKYSPEGSLLRQYQYKMLEEILFIDEICKKNNITYFLCGGSALGAIRHHGFIPWDDDMDIALYEKDWKKLCNILIKMQHEKYVLHCQQTDFNYVFAFPKFRERIGDLLGGKPARGKLYKYKGVGVDIFCIAHDTITTNKATSFIRGVLLNRMYKINNSLLRKVVTRVNWIMWRLIAYIIRIFCNLGKKNSDYYFAVGQGFPDEYFPPEDILPVNFVDFEGVKLPVPKDADKYLTRRYGNWQELPNEIAVHNKCLTIK